MNEISIFYTLYVCMFMYDYMYVYCFRIEQYSCVQFEIRPIKGESSFNSARSIRIFIQ